MKPKLSRLRIDSIGFMTMARKERKYITFFYYPSVFTSYFKEKNPREGEPIYILRNQCRTNKEVGRLYEAIGCCGFMFATEFEERKERALSKHYILEIVPSMYNVLTVPNLRLEQHKFN